MSRAIRPVLAALTLASCGFLDEPTDFVVTGDTGPTVVPEPEPEVRCNSDLETVGIPGGHAVDEILFTWEENGQLAASPTLQVRLPEDIRALAFTGMANEGILSVSRVRLSGVDRTDDINRDPFAEGLIQVSMPTNFGTDLTVDIPQGGDCLRIDLRGSPELAGGPGQLNVLTRRGGDANVIDLNLVFVGGSESSVSTQQVDEMVERINATWNRLGGPAVGETQIFTLGGSALATYAQATQAAGAAVEPDDATGIDVFFFNDITDGEQGLLGFSGGIPGVLGFDGVPNSGVVILLDGHRFGGGNVSGRALGSTIAHEVGHQIGLHHSTERDGSSQARYSDVTRCGSSNDTDGDGLVDAFECQGRGAENFMFWQSDGFLVGEISPEQAFVLSQSAAGR